MITSRRVKRGSFWLAVLTLSLIHPCCADNDFRWFTKPLNIPERGTLTSYGVITCGQHFSFLPPQRWSVKLDAAKRTIQLTPEDLSAGIRITISPETEQDRTELSVEPLRQKILERYPGAKIVNEFKCYTSGNEGLAFDVVREAQKHTAVASRIAFVEFANGMVEFELMTTTKTFADYRYVFGSLLASFRIQPAGPAR